MWTQSGFEEEKYLEWKVKYCGAKKFEITATNTLRHRTARRVYVCTYRPVFGVDIVDSQNINRLLDEAINEVQ